MQAPSIGIRPALRPGPPSICRSPPGKAQPSSLGRLCRSLAPVTTAPVNRPVSLQFQAHLTDKTGDRERCEVRTLTTTNIGVTVVQTVAPGLVIGTTARVVRGGIEGCRQPNDLRPRCRRHGVGLGHAVWSDGQEPEGARVSSRRRAASNEPAGPGGRRAGSAIAADGSSRAVLARGGCRPDDDAGPEGRKDARPRSAASTGWQGASSDSRAGVRWSTLGDSYRAFSGGFTVKLPRSVHVEGQVTKPTGIRRSRMERQAHE